MMQEHKQEVIYSKTYDTNIYSKLIYVELTQAQQVCHWTCIIADSARATLYSTRLAKMKMKP